MNWSDWIARWGDIVIGGLIGTAAKYGLHVSEGKVISRRYLIGDGLLLAFVLLVARLAADWMKLDRRGLPCAALSVRSVLTSWCRFSAPGS